MKLQKNETVQPNVITFTITVQTYGISTTHTN